MPDSTLSEDGIALPEQRKPPPGALELTFWVIYDHPKDFPQGFVLRAQWPMKGGGDGIVQDRIAWYAADPEQLRSILPPGVTCLGRNPEDDRAILEVWV